MNLTHRQKEAIQSWRKGNICVVAGPGSGKTTVLVERVRWLVEKKHVRPSEILAITFTEKAAAQMKERLVRECKNPVKRGGYERAQISTIHAFCHRLLQENALQAGLDPGFRVFDEWNADFALRGAVAETLDEIYSEQPEQTLNFLRAFAGSSALAQTDLSQVHGQLLTLYDAIRAWGGEPFLSPVEVAEPYQQLIRTLEEAGRQRNDSRFIELSQNLTNAGERPAERLRELAAVEATLKSYDARGRHGKVISCLRKELVPNCRGVLLAAHFDTPRQWLSETLGRIDRRYRQSKKEGAALDFTDLEHYAVWLLEKEAGDLSIDFRHILIDEYQDTSPLQARLIELLRNQRGKRERTLFAVGDINQSIYGFRNADPDVFRDYREQVEREQGHVVRLEENFRSRAEILRIVETTFQTSGAPPGISGKTRHGSAERKSGIEKHRLLPGREREFGSKSIPSVEAFIARGKSPAVPQQLEADHIANRIKELRNDLRQDGKILGLEWRDFAILLRSRSLIDRFAARLRLANVPYQLAAGQGFFEAEEVRDVIRLLQVLRNPRDEVSLAAVLCSPLVGISDEALFQLKLAANHNSLADGLRKSSQGLSADDAARIEEFRDLLKRYRSLRDEVPAAILLDRLVSETGFWAYWSSQPNGASHAANIRKLIRLIEHLSESGNRPFEQVVERVEQLRLSRLPEQEAPLIDESVDAVNVMTLHAAKGLEFPVVFLPSLQSGPGRDGDSVSFHKKQGVGAKWVDPFTGQKHADPAFERSREETKRKTSEESDRLLYVAMTRAEQHLVLSASFGQRKTARSWSKYLVNELGIAPDEIENAPVTKRIKGTPVRVLVTDRPPSVVEAAQRRTTQSEAIALQPAAVTDASDSVAAVTSVALFAECPRKYYLSRYLGFDAGPSPEWTAPSEEGDDESDRPDATELGIQVHGLLAGSLPRKGASEQAIQLARRFEESSLGRRAASARSIRREQSLLFQLDSHLLQGQIDLWFDDGNEHILIDYKTDQVSEREMPRRAQDYAVQIQLYAEALEQQSGRRPDRAILYFLQPDAALEIPAGPAEGQAARQAVHDFFKAQTDLNFPLHVGPHCRRCAHYGRQCPAKLPRRSSASAAASERV